jgi:hypothetical protein
VVTADRAARAHGVADFWPDRGVPTYERSCGIQTARRLVTSGASRAVTGRWEGEQRPVFRIDSRRSLAALPCCRADRVHLVDEQQRGVTPGGAKGTTAARSAPEMSTAAVTMVSSRVITLTTCLLA